jgi:nitrile hydratase accessory protein
MTASLPHATRLTLDDIASQCAGGLPMPTMNESFVFAEPWQAQAFAMTLQLHEKGVFTWSEWAAALTHEIQQAQSLGGKDDGRNYYHHWLNALEQMVIDRHLGTPDQIHDLEHAWEAAAARTPHGQPIVLDTSL